MSHLTRRLMVLVSAMVILALALAAVGSVRAQEGDATTQSGPVVTVEEGDTLGDLFARYAISEDDLDLFVNQNAQLRVQEGQTVTFPEGVVVDTTVMDDGAGAAGRPAADTTTDDTTTTGDTAAAGQDQVSVEREGFVCDPLTVNGGETYVTEAGDTLGRLLRMMGYDVNVVDGAAVDMAADQGQAGQPDLVDFIHLNCELSFEGSQQFMLPAAALPVTGQVAEDGDEVAEATPTPTPDDAADTTDDATEATPTPTADDTADATGDTAGVVADDEYGTQEGDTLGSLIDRWTLTGESLRDFLDDNDDLEVVSGQPVNIPAGVEFDAGNENIQDNVYTTQVGDTLGDIFDEINLNLTGGLLGGDQADISIVEALVNDNRGLQLVAGQDVEVPEGVPATGDTTDQDAAGVTDTGEQDDALGDITLDEGTSLGELIDRYNLTTDEEIAAFVRANRGLRVEGGQNVTAPAAIPETGAQQQEQQQTQQQSQQQGQVTVPDEAGLFPSLNLHLGRDEAVPAGRGVYIIQGGDSLYGIARKFDTDIQTLRDLNPNTLFNNGDVIFSGQRIYVPGVENPPGGWQNHLLDLAPSSQ